MKELPKATVSTEVSLKTEDSGQVAPLKSLLTECNFLDATSSVLKMDGTFRRVSGFVLSARCVTFLGVVNRVPRRTRAGRRPATPGPCSPDPRGREPTHLLALTLNLGLPA